MCYSHPLYHPECSPCSIYTFLQTNETTPYTHDVSPDTAIAIGPIAIDTRT